MRGKIDKYQDFKIHKTAKGEMVRSKSEVIIADLLYMYGIEYDYEKTLYSEKERIPINPDFTIWDARKRRQRRNPKRTFLLHKPWYSWKHESTPTSSRVAP